MQYQRPQNVLTGFQAQRPDESVPELLHVGEQWAPFHPGSGRAGQRAWEFFLQLDGSSVWEAEGRIYTLRAGHFFATPPRVAHQLRHRPNNRLHFFFTAVDVRPVLRRHPTLRALWERNTCIFFRHGQSLEASFRRLLREASMRMDFRGEAIRAALDSLVIEVTRLFQHAGSRVMLPTHPAVAQTKQLLEAHPDQPWRLSDLGKLAGVSPNHLVQLFTREVGLSPHKYLVRQRIERAKELLRQGDRAVTDVARELGFASSQHFAKIFRQEVRCSALAYRKRFQGKARDAGEAKARTTTAPGSAGGAAHSPPVAPSSGAAAAGGSGPTASSPAQAKGQGKEGKGRA